MSTDTATEVASKQQLQEVAARVRWHIVSTVAASKAGHIGGPLSATDLLVSLYFSELRIDPTRPDDPARDRFILSKGHSAIALYAVLAERGYFPVEELATFDHGNSRLQGHPDMHRTPGIDASTGSLGMGLSVGLGMAIAANRLGQSFHTYVMLGDGESAEGQVWEAVIAASRYSVDNLTAIWDLNGLQQYGFEGSPRDRFDRGEPMGHVDMAAVLKGFGWNVISIDGNDLDQIQRAFDENRGLRTSGRPTAILATTTKGAGLSFTAGTYKWHNGVPTPELLELAKSELFGEKGPNQ